jgi:pimeloyl-ACP methyl ester carboxylesterase
MNRLRLLIGALFLSALVLPAPVAFAGNAANVVDIRVDGASNRLLFLAPPARPAAAVVMFPGGDGVIAITDDGAIAKPNNFLIRTRDLWLAQGLLFVAVDTPPGQGRARTGDAGQRAIAAIVAEVKKRTGAPIWLVGTSAGAPAAMAGAASLPAGAIHGAAISSPVSTGGRRETVFDVKLESIAVPVLIQIHEDDGCQLTPPANAQRIKSALTAAPAVEIQQFSGGSYPRSGPCEALAPHGFLGIEDKVVAAAAGWIKQH